jgi:Ion channel
MSEDHKTHHIPPLSGMRASIKFFHYVYRIIKFIWPIFSSLLVLIMLLGLVIGMREGWTIGDSLYFSFITGFTIGYGDITPHYPLTKILAVVLAAVGFLFTGILVAIAVEALRFTITGKSPLDKYKE